jgi:hypothetical protein
VLKTTFVGIYRDDDILVFDKIKTTDEICDGLEAFQREVDELTASEHLQFTVDIWDPSGPIDLVPRLKKKVTVNRNEYFSYLDMELYWRDEALAFKVHLKENQALKYLNEGSCHTSSCFKSIPHGVLRRLSILTSMTPENKDKPLNKLYPEHTKALEHAKLPVLPKTYPSLQESLETIREREAARNNLTDESNLAEELQAKKQRQRPK